MIATTAPIDVGLLTSFVMLAGFIATPGLLWMIWSKLGQIHILMRERDRHQRPAPPRDL